MELTAREEQESLNKKDNGDGRAVEGVAGHLRWGVEHHRGQRTVEGSTSIVTKGEVG